MPEHYTAISVSVLRALLFLIVVAWLNHARAADLKLSWTDNSDNESGFTIERKTGTNGTFFHQATVGANVATYVDTGLAAATTFCYRVSAFNSAGNSPFTPDVCTDTPAVTLPPTFEFSLTHGGNKSVISGQSVSNIITASLVSGSSESVSFSASGLPPGATASFSSANSCSLTCSRTLNIATPASTSLGTYPITVTASGGGLTKTTTFSLTLNSTRTAPSLVASPTIVPVDGTITAAWNGIAAPTSRDWIGLYVPSKSALIEWMYVSCSKSPGSARATGSCPFALPSSLGPGTYELRLLSDDGDTVLATSNTFTVGGGPIITVSPTSVTVAGTVTVTWSGIAKATATDWIGLTVPGAGNNALHWMYVSCSKLPGSARAAGACPFALPSSLGPGTYELRLFSNDGNTVLATSQALSVTTSQGSFALALAATNNAGPALSINVVKTLTNGGSGDGTVTSSPAGINCGSVCTHPYTSGTVIKLVATAAAGSTFTGWSGDADCKDGTVTMGTNTSCTATFKALTVSSSTSADGVLETTALDQGVTKIGVYRPATGDIFLDRNGNGEWEGCSIDVCMKWLAQASGIPVAADWEGTGTTSIGTFDSNSAAWYLDGNGNGRWEGCAVDFCINSFGEAGNVPVLGSDGTNGALLGVYRPKTASWQFDSNGNNVLDPCGVDTCYSNFGGENKFGLSGDWDGEGKRKIATFEAASGSWLIDANGNGVRDACGVDRCYSRFGQTGDIPVAGDWDGSGKTKIGIFRPSTGQWFLDKNGSGQLDSCGIDICITAFGQPGDKPVVGKWLGDSLGSGVSGVGF